MLFASALFLASGFARGSRSERLGHVIARHLECLAERRELPGAVRELCDQLALQWQDLAHEQTDAARPQRRPALFAIGRFGTLSRDCGGIDQAGAP